MSSWPACFVASTFDQSDWLKLLGIAGAMLVLYILARRLGGGNESYPASPETSNSTQLSTSQLDPAEPQESQETEEIGSDELEHEEPLIPAEEEVEPRNTEIQDWNFAKFDIEAGPPNRESFADELFVNFYDRSTEQPWNKTYLVATPAGLEKILRKSNSNVLFLPQTLLLRRYDVNHLRKAVLGDVGRMEEERGHIPADGNEDEAPGQKD